MGWPFLIRIALIDLDPLLADILADRVDRDPDSELVARLVAPTDVRELVATTDVDGVITRMKPGWEADVQVVLEHNPRANVVGVPDHAAAGVHYELKAEATVLDDVSPHALLDAAKADPDWTPEPVPLT
jgi:aspartokinase-like uncharacterized kinase